MTPFSPDPMTSACRGLFFDKPSPSLEIRFQSVAQISRLFSSSKLGFTWLGIVEKGDPLAYADARKQIKGMQDPFVFATCGRKTCKFIRYTKKNFSRNGVSLPNITCWIASGVGAAGKGMQAVSLICRAICGAGLGLIAELFAGMAAALTSFLESIALGMRLVNAAGNKKKYLLLKFAQEILSLACSILTVIGLLFAFINPAAPWIFAALATGCFFLGISKYFFKSA